MFNQKFSAFFRLGRDPERKETANGKHLTVVSGACSNGKDKDPLWLDLVFWGDKGTNIRQYARKGTEIFVEGKLTMHKWTDKNDNVRKGYSVEVWDSRIIGGWKEKAGTQGQRTESRKPEIEVPKSDLEELKPKGFVDNMETRLDDDIPF